MKKVLVVFGTRPEAIKMAPVVEALDSSFDVKICVTAQHREMLDQVLDLFDITPDIDLDLMESGQDLFDISSKILLSLKAILENESPEAVLVHGDTTTSFMSALAAYYLKIPVCHVEAGLRTDNIYSPFPEEINRQLISRLAIYHFSPTKLSKDNLIREGVAEEKIFVTGNTVVDALSEVRKKATNYKFSSDILNELKFLTNPHKNTDEIILVTGHRRENFGHGFEEICLGIKDIAMEFPNVNIVYPVHLNPNALEPPKRLLGDIENVFLIKPLDYLPFVKLMDLSKIIITDSGGIQEELL